MAVDERADSGAFRRQRFGVGGKAQVLCRTLRRNAGWELFEGSDDDLGPSPLSGR
jgi:hypothetical protein